jgi:hypothetical protein
VKFDGESIDNGSKAAKGTYGTTWPLSTPFRQNMMLSLENLFQNSGLKFDGTKAKNLYSILH